jgi:hypothetical protein
LGWGEVDPIGRSMSELCPRSCPLAWCNSVGVRALPGSVSPRV